MAKVYQMKRFLKVLEELKKDSVVMHEEGVTAIAAKRLDLLNADTLDLIFDEYVQCNIAPALAFSVSIPNGSSVTMNVIEKDTFQWTTQSNADGSLEVTFDFVMTGEQKSEQIQALRESGIEDGCILKLTEDGESYIDYGELDPKCTVKLKIPKDMIAGWSLRSEDVDINSPSAPEGKEPGYIHGILIALKDPLTSQTKNASGEEYYVLFGLCSPLALFSEEDVNSAAQFPENKDEIRLRTDEDLAGMSEPPGYKDWDGQTHNDLYERYRDDILAVRNRADQWKCIFGMNDKHELYDWVNALSSRGVYGDYQATIIEFFQFLLLNNKYDNFMIRLNREMDRLKKAREKQAIAEKMAQYIHSDDTIKHLLATRDAMNRLVIVMMDLMDQMKLEHDENGNLGKRVTQAETEKFMSELAKLPEKQETDKLVHELILLIALDAGLMTKEQTELPPEELLENEAYSMICNNLDAITKEFVRISNNK